MSSNKEERAQATDFSTLFQELKADLTSYLNSRIAYHKLVFLERLSQTSSLLAIGLAATFLAFSAFAFALIALSFYIGELLGSYAAGFGIVALFWLFLLILVFVFYKPIKDFFLNRTIRILLKLDKEDENEQE